MKTGGFTAFEKTVLLGSSSLVRYFQSYPISADIMAAIMVMLRALFCFFFFLQATLSNYIIKIFFVRHKALYVVLGMITASMFIIFQPVIFRALFSSNYHLQQFFVSASDILILSVIVISLLFYFVEYFDISVPIIRSMHINLIISSSMLCVIFIFFASLNPVTVFQDYWKIRVYSSAIISIQGYNAYYKWVIVLSICLLMLFSLLFYNIKYYRYAYNRSKEELLIKSRSKALGNSYSILVHGLKNQIIVAEVLISQLVEQIESCSRSVEEERFELSQLSEQIELMHKRLDIIYRSFMRVELRLIKTSMMDLFFELRDTIPLEKDRMIVYEIGNASIIADKELIIEAIRNIIDNAIEATANIEVPNIRVSCVSTRARVMITISNNGPAITSNVKKQMFQPFNTTKNTGNNWGLGLFYSHMIIKMHFGEILVNSTDKDGTQFMILLPRNRIKI